MRSVLSPTFASLAERWPNIAETNEDLLQSLYLIPPLHKFPNLTLFTAFSTTFSGLLEDSTLCTGPGTMSVTSFLRLLWTTWNCKNQDFTRTFQPSMWAMRDLPCYKAKEADCSDSTHPLAIIGFLHLLPPTNRA